MKPHESPRINKKNQFVAIRAIRGLCGIGVYGGGSVAVDSLLILVPIVGFCVLFHVLLYIALCPF